MPLNHLTWNQVGYRAKPCCLPDHRRMVLTSPDPGELICSPITTRRE
ncbi:hypothetical protein ACR42D_05305 [Desulfovibrio caledoniensis]